MKRVLILCHLRMPIPLSLPNSTELYTILLSLILPNANIHELHVHFMSINKII